MRYRIVSKGDAQPARYLAWKTDHGWGWTDLPRGAKAMGYNEALETARALRRRWRVSASVEVVDIAEALGTKQLQAAE